MSRILITGAGGMVGRNFLAHPSTVDFELVCPSSRELNLRDSTATEAYIREAAPDLILHLAGRSWGIQAIARDPIRSFLDILDVGRNVVVGARNSGVKRLINIGTSSMYPRDALSPLSEDCVLGGPFEPNVEPYALAKVAILRLCQYHNRAAGALSFKTLIPCNLYGPHARFSADDAVLIPAVMLRLHQARMEDRPSEPIWGDGTARREFMYVGDLADCLVQAVRRFDTLPEILNVGTGEDCTIEDYYREIAAVVGFKGTFARDLTRPVGFRRKLLDSTRLRLWGWEPRIPLQEGLRATYRYFIEQVAHVSTASASRTDHARL